MGRATGESGAARIGWHWRQRRWQPRWQLRGADHRQRRHKRDSRDAARWWDHALFGCRWSGQRRAIRITHASLPCKSKKAESNNATTSHQETQTRDSRSVTRRDLSAEVRRRGVEIRQGGVYEDLILVTIPINRRLTGGYTTRPALGLQAPPRSLDCLRVRIEHLPPGVRMDVEFRGRTVPKEGRAGAMRQERIPAVRRRCFGIPEPARLTSRHRQGAGSSCKAAAAR